MADTPRIEELRRRVQVDPASIAFAALAEEFRKQGRYEEAIATCAAGLQRHPAYLSAHVTLGRALLEVGRFDEAQEELEHVLRVAPENLAAIRGLAEIHHRRGELPEVHAQDADPRELAPATPADIEPQGPPARIAVSSAPAMDEPDATAVRPAARPHPALVDLEVFLGAIVTAREEAAGHR